MVKNSCLTLKNRLQRIQGFLVFVFGLVTAFSARADDGQNVWVITNLEPPFIMEGERGKITGYAAELVKNVLANAGIEQTILATRWQRLEKEATTKGNVIVFALSRTEERESKYHWITPLTANMYGVYGHKGRASQVEKLSALNHYSGVAVLSGDLRQQILRDAGVTNIRSFDYWPEALESFVNNPDEVIFFSDPGMRIYCKPLGNRCDKVVRIFDYDIKQTYLAISKPGTDMNLVKRIKQEAEAFKQTKEFEQLAIYWLDQYSRTTDFPMHLDNGVINLWEK